MNKVDVAAEYDAYYRKGADGKTSIYDMVSGNHVIPRDIMLIQRAVFKVLKANRAAKNKESIQKITIVDYGAGDGRHLPVYQHLSKKLKKLGIEIELTAYDPSQVGLEIYRDKLKEAGFSIQELKPFHKLNNKKPGTLAYEALNAKKNNLSIRLVHGHVNDSLEHVKNVLGNADVVFCLYGTLSHIIGRKSRQNILSMFREIVSDVGQILVTVPTLRRFHKEQKAFNYLRKNHYPEQILQNATEAGDLYYTRYDEETEQTVTNYYHLYTSRELVEDFKSVGLVIPQGVQANKLLHEKTMSKAPLLGFADAAISKRIPSFLVDKAASYIAAIGENSLEKNKETKFSDRVRDYNSGLHYSP